MGPGDRDQRRDVALAKVIRAGSPAAENLFVARHLPSVQRMVRALVRDRSTHAEIVDDVLMVTLLALRRGSVRNPSQVRAFMHGVAVRLVSGRQRHSRQRMVVLPLTSDVPCDEREPVLGEDAATALRRSMACLSLADRLILELAFVHGFTPAEIGRHVGLAEASARQRKSRAVRRLRQRLRPEPTT